MKTILLPALVALVACEPAPTNPCIVAVQAAKNVAYSEGHVAARDAWDTARAVCRCSDVDAGAR